jgi:hypothetical protein
VAAPSYCVVAPKLHFLTLVIGLTKKTLVNVIQAAWKNLKDTHIKVRQKSERKSRDPNRAVIDTVVRWKFWDAMEFMRDVPVTPRSRNK